MTYTARFDDLSGVVMRCGVAWIVDVTYGACRESWETCGRTASVQRGTTPAASRRSGYVLKVDEPTDIDGIITTTNP